MNNKNLNNKTGDNKLKNLNKTKTTLKFLGLLVSAVFTVYITGCSENSVNNPGDQTDNQFLQQVVQSGYSTNQEDVDNLMSYETADLNDGGAITDNEGPLSPIDSLKRWGRRIINVNVNFNISNSGDTLKTVNITRTITGVYVIIGYVNGQLDSVSKPYQEVFYRNVVFKRIARTQHPRFNWRLYQISLLSGGTVSPQPASNAQITKIEVFVNGSNTPTYIFNGPDFTQNTFITRMFGGPGIPEVQRGSQVQVVVTTNSTDSLDIVDWHWARNTFGLHRIPFTLLSSTSNGNGTFTEVYSKTFFIYGGHRIGGFNGYLSALTRHSLYDNDPNLFASSEVGIPYRVTR